MNRKREAAWKGVVLLLVLSALVAIGGCAGQASPTSSSNDIDEEAYLLFRAETHASLVNSFASFESLASNPFHTPQWEGDLKFSIAAIMFICKEIQNTQAPEKYRVSHDYLQAAAYDYSLAMEYFMARNTEQMVHHLVSGDANYDEAARLLQ